MDLVNDFSKELDRATAGVANLAVKSTPFCELGSSSANFATASKFIIDL